MCPLCDLESESSSGRPVCDNLDGPFTRITLMPSRWINDEGHSGTTLSQRIPRRGIFEPRVTSDEIERVLLICYQGLTGFEADGGDVCSWSTSE